MTQEQDLANSLPAIASKAAPRRLRPPPPFGRRTYVPLPGPSFHVYPVFGPEHLCETGQCWCHPWYELTGASVIVIPNVMH